MQILSGMTQIGRRLVMLMQNHRMMFETITISIIKATLLIRVWDIVVLIVKDMMMK